MSKTRLSFQGEKVLINGKLVYMEIPNCPEKNRGLLMNARFIQGVFHDAADERRFDRFGRRFDPEENTGALIRALPEWYASGLRAFTVGFQGGGPCFTTINDTIENSPYSPDGLTLDAAYAARMQRLLKAADELGMVVIVSLLYCGQIHRLLGAQAVLNAVRTASAFVRASGFTNVILEIANEYDIPPYHDYPIVQTAQGVVALLELARRESCVPVGASGGGGTINREVAQASDVILFHGNGQSRQQMVQCVEKARLYSPGKPIVCNEDSQALSNLQVCMDLGVSWGYYNNMTKQEPPTDWGITFGEDAYFAARMAQCLGITQSNLSMEESYTLQGLSSNEQVEGMYWLRVASLYPESINYVDFYRNGERVYRCYDDPFTLDFNSNWQQGGRTGAAEWRAEIHLRDGRILKRHGMAN